MKADEDSEDERSDLSMGSNHEIGEKAKEMILAIRAPYGSTLEIPLDS